MVEKDFETPFFLLCGLKPNPDFPKTQFEMLEQSQSSIFLLKVYPQFSQDSEHSFQEIHNFHKHLSHTCKKSFVNQFHIFKIIFQIF